MHKIIFFLDNSYFMGYNVTCTDELEGKICIMHYWFLQPYFLRLHFI